MSNGESFTLNGIPVELNIENKDKDWLRLECVDRRNGNRVVAYRTEKQLIDFLKNKSSKDIKI